MTVENCTLNGYWTRRAVRGLECFPLLCRYCQNDLLVLHQMMLIAVGECCEVEVLWCTQYGVHSFFSEEHFCMSHRDDGTPKCSSCGRYAPRHATAVMPPFR